MATRPFAHFAVSVVIAGFVFFGSPSAFGQCGTNFRSSYRAVDKIRRFSQTGGDFGLQDWTNDGRSDFWNFRFNQATQTSDIVIYPALPAGYWNWDAPIIYSTTLNSSATTVNTGCCFRYQLRDFDSDGKLDMLIGDIGNPDHRIHRNTGNGILAPQAVVARPGDTNTTYYKPGGYADVNGDGRLDWIYRLEMISNGEETFYYSLLNADGSLSTPNLILANGGGNEVNDSTPFLGDFDGDGKVDILYSSFSAPHRYRVLKNLGNGSFTLGNPQQFGSFSFNGLKDINGDGRLDLYGDSGNSVVVLYAQSDLTFTSASFPVTNTSSYAYLLQPVDFNGDGRLDLINVDDNDYEIFLNNGAGGFTSQFYSKRLTYPYPSLYLHFEDFNADGKADLYDRRHDIFNTFSEEVVVIKSNVCDSKGQTRAMEFGSASAIPDIVSWNGANGQWRYGDGEWNPGASTPIQSFNWGSASLGDIPAPGDFDGDGRTDHTVYRNGEGNWYVYLSATSSWSVFRFGLPGDIPIPNDYDGGGKTDYAVFRPSDGNWYIWFNETQQFGAVHWGANGDRPVPADFDGDAKTDIAVFRPSGGDWYILRSSDLSYGIVHWGIDSDVPLPADYDGDGKADLAVYRSGTWYILRTSNGALALISWGTATDVPLPFMERGEVALPVVFRPSNSRWYSSRYPVGYALLLSGPPVYFGLPNN